MHGCQDVVRIWQDLGKTAKMLVIGSTRAALIFMFFINGIFRF